MGSKLQLSIFRIFKIAILLQLIAILKIWNIDNCNFDPIFLALAIHYFGVAIIAIVNVYTNVYKFLYYIAKVQYVKWHISMSWDPPLRRVCWHTKEMYVIHYKYYNTYTFLQANGKPQKTANGLLFFLETLNLNSIQHCSKVAILKSELQFQLQ